MRSFLLQNLENALNVPPEAINSNYYFGIGAEVSIKDAMSMMYYGGPAKLNQARFMTLVEDYAKKPENIRRQEVTEMVCSAVYALDNHLIRTNKLDTSPIYDKLHQILKAKLAEYLPSVDSDVGIRLSEPSFENGRAYIQVPGVLSFELGFVNMLYNPLIRPNEPNTLEAVEMRNYAARN